MEYKCPQCGKESAWKGNKYRPFCSERCKLIDLGTWADEKYKVETNLDDIDATSTFENDE